MSTTAFEVQPQTDPAGGFHPVQERVAVAPTFTLEDLQAAMEKVRKEEKDKLYPELKEQRELLSKLQQDAEARRAAEEQARAEAEQAQRLAEEAELSAKDLIEKKDREWKQMLEDRENSWKSEFTTLSEQARAQQAMLDKEREFNELSIYTQQKIAENAENIAPELVNWIKGNSRDEIDAAVADAVATTNSLIAGFQQAQQVAPTFTQQTVSPGTSVASGPAGLDPSQQYQSLTPDDINQMDMATYAKYRSQLIKASGQQSKGMYG